MQVRFWIRHSESILSNRTSAERKFINQTPCTYDSIPHLLNRLHVNRSHVDRCIVMHFFITNDRIQLCVCRNIVLIVTGTIGNITLIVDEMALFLLFWFFEDRFGRFGALGAPYRWWCIVEDRIIDYTIPLVGVAVNFKRFVWKKWIFFRIIFLVIRSVNIGSYVVLKVDSKCCNDLSKSTLSNSSEIRLLYEIQQTDFAFGNTIIVATGLHTFGLKPVKGYLEEVYHKSKVKSGI